MPIPREIETFCDLQDWIETKIREFWIMRKNLAEPKTSIEFDSLDKDKIFCWLWDGEHLEALKLVPRDGSEDYQNDSSMNPQDTPSTSIISLFHHLLYSI